MNMQTICVLMVLSINIICMIIISGVLIYTGMQINKELKSKRLLKEKELLLSIDIDNSTLQLIDSIITDSINTYRIFNFEGKEKIYISDKMQKDMISSILKDVLGKISPVLYEKLSMIYNREKFEDQIYLKISMAVLQCVVEINGSYEE